MSQHSTVRTFGGSSEHFSSAFLSIDLWLSLETIILNITKLFKGQSYKGKAPKQKKSKRILFWIMSTWFSHRFWTCTRDFSKQPPAELIHYQLEIFLQWFIATLSYRIGCDKCPNKIYTNTNYELHCKYKYSYTFLYIIQSKFFINQFKSNCYLKIVSYSLKGIDNIKKS